MFFEEFFDDFHVLPSAIVFHLQFKLFFPNVTSLICQIKFSLQTSFFKICFSGGFMNIISVVGVKYPDSWKIFTPYFGNISVIDLNKNLVYHSYWSWLQATFGLALH